MAKVAQSLAKLISQSKKKKTGPYDTQATVKRVEGNTVWVSIPGGVDETPINKTVNCSAGDKVQVRVSGGRAWITGNASAPPTDDKTANEAKTKAVVAEATAIGAKETADAVEDIAVNASATAVTAKTIAEGVNEHFWHDSTGAHVTEVTQEEWNEPTDPNYHSGGNTLITTQGMAIRDGLYPLAEFSASEAVIGQNVNGMSRTKISTSGMQIIRNVNGADTSIANLGYGPGNDSGGGTSNAPFYTFGTRLNGSDIGIYSTATGYNTKASGAHSFTSGLETIASNTSAVAEGTRTEASGASSHAGGTTSTAAHSFSLAHGIHLTTGRTGQAVFGMYNETNASALFIVGNGSDDNSPSNAFTVNTSGNVKAAGSITAEGHDSEIGYRTTRQSGSYSVATGTSWVTVPAANLTRITLSPGVWIIHAQVSFASNSTGWRGLRIYDVTTSESIGRSSVTQPACNGATTNMNTMAILSLTESNTFTLQVVQNSGAARNVDLQFHAVRIA